MGQGNENESEGYDQDRTCGSARWKARGEEVGLLQAYRQPGGDRDQRGEEVWQVLDPELVQDQDAQEAGHQGRETHDVRQGGRREGKAGENNCKGLPRSKGETERLIVAKRWSCGISPTSPLAVGPPAEWASVGVRLGKPLSQNTCALCTSCRFPMAGGSAGTVGF